MTAGFSRKASPRLDRPCEPDVLAPAPLILVCCTLIIMIDYGNHQSFGLFMSPISLDMG